MRPVGFLLCLGKALARRLGDVVGMGRGVDVAIQVSQDVWAEWQKERDEKRRREELQAVVAMAVEDFRKEVAVVVQQVAGNLDAVVQKRLAEALGDVSQRLRQSFQQAGESSHMIPLTDSRDLAALLTGEPKGALARVTLVQIDGPLKGRQFVFEQPGSTIVGREEGCHPPFPKDKDHKTMSRHHCLLDINPPDVRVRDLGSASGTYVNDQLIGKRGKDLNREQGKRLRLPECNLKHGDELRLCKSGTAIFQVQIEVPANMRESDSRLATRCVRCGRDVAAEIVGQRQGDFICSVCREKMQAEPNVDPPTIHGYKVLHLLGQGGMGMVWLGRKEQGGELTALKVMLPRVAADSRAVKRFLREIKVTRGLLHPNVVRVNDADYQGGTFFIALEYCDSGSVAELMAKRGGTLPVDEAVEITLQALEGLQYAHNLFDQGKGVVHRDLKPANLFLAGTGSGRLAKVGDYGLAKAFEDTGLSGLTRTGESAGTPRFMPRQQIRYFKDPQPDFDVWAMAASLYNMLTGRTPRSFPKGEDPWLVLTESDPVPILKRNPKLPAKLAQVIDHALTETPAIGFKTAAAFKEALEDAV